MNQQISADTPVSSRYRDEAGNFIQMMSDLDSRFALDFTYESIQRLEGFIAETFDANGHSGEQFPLGVGAYVGETIIRSMGGQWSPDGAPEIIGLGSLESTNPIEKARQRFSDGPKASLSWYYQTLRRQYYLTGGGELDDEELQDTVGSEKPSGCVFACAFNRLFGRFFGQSG